MHLMKKILICIYAVLNDKKKTFFFLTQWNVTSYTFIKLSTISRNIVLGDLGSFKHCQAHTGGRAQLPSPLLSGGGFPPLPPSQTRSACSLPAKCAFANVPWHIIHLPSMYPSLESSL